MGNIGIWQLVLVILLVVLIFGSKKLRCLGSDLGAALKNYKKETKDEKENNKIDE